MAARKDSHHTAEVRKRIQTSQLINRLHSNAMGDVEMTPAQVRSAEILLKKAIPDLQAIEHTTDGDNGFVVKLVSQVGTVSADS